MQAFLCNISTSLTVVVTLITIYVSARIAYNIFFHPLRSFPGPFLHRASFLPTAYYMFKGEIAWHVADLHNKYGPIVRISPIELSILEPEAWKEVYAVRSGGGYLEKYMPFYRPNGRRARSIITENKEEHAVLRKLIAPAFSDKSMREQEPVIGRYVDLLLHRLTERCDAGNAALNMRDWYNYTTFDVIGSLAFGEDFGCLQTGEYHPWVAAILQSIREGGYLSAVAMLGFKPFLSIIVLVAGKNRMKHVALTKQKLHRRINKGNEEPDIIGRLIDKKDELNFSFETLQANSGALTIAGSETTATLLTGVTYLLLAHPQCLQKVTEEIRSSFGDTKEITLISVNGLTYMMACLNEALRLYPPVPRGLPRKTPSEGATIAGTFVPGDCVVSVWPMAMHRNKHYFKLPNEFRPERFLGDARFADDHLDAVQPFLVGPRNCIGRPLAYAEMRLILAKILFSFDLRLAEDSKNWIEKNKVYSLWFKPDLNVYLTPAVSKD